MIEVLLTSHVLHTSVRYGSAAVTEYIPKAAAQTAPIEGVADLSIGKHFPFNTVRTAIIDSELISDTLFLAETTRASLVNKYPAEYL